MIRPIDIQEKEFSKAVRGYKEDEVNEFLDEITIDLEPVSYTHLDVYKRQVDTPVFTMRESREPEKIALAAIKEAERKGCNVLIVDTAGRLQIDVYKRQDIQYVLHLRKRGEKVIGIDEQNRITVISNRR